MKLFVFLFALLMSVSSGSVVRADICFSGPIKLNGYVPHEQEASVKCALLKALENDYFSLFESDTKLVLRGQGLTVDQNGRPMSRQLVYVYVSHTASIDIIMNEPALFKASTSEFGKKFISFVCQYEQTRRFFDAGGVAEYRIHIMDNASRHQSIIRDAVIMCFDSCEEQK